jgi:predicted RNA binding protein YcfA (HicA-like mRNA interferase family)
MGSRNVRFTEFASLIAAFGFTLERITGSHHIYIHPEVPQAVSVQPDENGQAKPYQLKQFVKLIEKYALDLEEGDISRAIVRPYIRQPRSAWAMLARFAASG